VRGEHPAAVAPRVKVCGLTRGQDALLAAELGADAVGFVFAPRSRRLADPEVVAAAVRELPPLVVAVGVFQDQPLEEVRERVRACGLHVAQLHGGEDMDYVRALGVPVLKAVALSCRQDVDRLAGFPGLGGFLLDTAAGGASGGTGQTFDWSWAREARRYGRVVLAGGLTPDNVAHAVRQVRPWGVDAASGTESVPGVKDPDKVRLFVERAKGAGRVTADQ